MKKIVLIVIALALGLSINAQDSNKNEIFKPTIKINGRIQYDFAFIKATDDDTDEVDWFNGNEFRRAYLSAKGKIGKKLGYKAEIEFAGGGVAYRDFYISYDAGKAGKIAFGSMAEATGLNMATSSKYTTFMERSVLTSFQNFRWQAGFHYMNYNLFDSGVTFQASYTNDNGSKGGDGFKNATLENAMGFTARTTYAYILDKEKHNFVHLGVNYDNRPGGNVKFRPENHMGVSKYDLGFGASEGRSDIGLELATNFGPLSIQGEYKMHSNEMPDKTYNANVYYAFVSYFITGEHRPYKKGTFGRVKPKNDVDNGGMGALEIAIRYAGVNSDEKKGSFKINDDVTFSDLDGLSNITLGVNWYLNSHARVMYNTVLTDLNGTNGEKQVAHMFRVAVDF